jgi:hypothetical protein
MMSRILNSLSPLVVVELLISTGFVGLLILGVVVFSNEYVPSADELQHREALAPFLVKPSNVEGIYGNRDVDSVVFRYTTAEGEDAFWQRVEQQSKVRAWIVVAPEGEARRFERAIPPDRKGLFWSVEEVRVRYLRANRAVVVGWVQADERHAVTRLAECSESRFAESAIWPHLRGE